MTPAPTFATSAPPVHASLARLRLLPLIGATFFMVSAGGPFGLEDIISMAGFGRALLLLAVIPILWSLPTALMVGELAAAMPREGGFYCWVRRAMGAFWGFQEAWLALAASVFDMALYPTALVLYLSRIAPQATSGHRGLAIKILMVVLCAAWNLRGAVFVGRSSAAMMAIAIAPFAALFVAGFWKAFHGGLGLHPAASARSTLNISAAVGIAMWNYMGWDNASTIAQEVDNPQRNYPRAMLWSALLVAVVYMLPLAAVWAAGIPADRFTTGAWADAATLLSGSGLAVFIVLVGAMSGVGTFNALALTLTRLPFAVAEDGLAPRILTLRNARAVPWVSVLACSLGWGLALGLTFERLISIDLVLYGGSLILEFIALIVLRIREPQMPRPFRIPGGIAGTILLSIPPTALIVFASYTARTERVAGLPALVFAALVGVAGALVYLAAKKKSGPQTSGTASSHFSA